MRGLGDLEAAVMNRLWDWDRSASVRDVLDDLNRDRELAYTTVQTVLDNLHRKGAVTRERHSRAFLYTAARSRSEYSAELIADAVSESADRTSALVQFFGQLTAKERALLRSALDDQSAGVPKGQRR